MLDFFSDFFLLVFICLILFLPGGSGADFSTFITIFLLILTLLLLLLSNDGATDDDDDDDDDDGDDGGGGGDDAIVMRVASRKSSGRKSGTITVLGKLRWRLEKTA